MFGGIVGVAACNCARVEVCHKGRAAVDLSWGEVRLDRRQHILEIKDTLIFVHEVHRRHVHLDNILTDGSYGIFNSSNPAVKSVNTHRHWSKCLSGWDPGHGDGYRYDSRYLLRQIRAFSWQWARKNLHGTYMPAYWCSQISTIRLGEGRESLTLSPVRYRFFPFNSENTSRNCCIKPTTCTARSSSFWWEGCKIHST